MHKYQEKDENKPRKNVKRDWQIGFHFTMRKEKKNNNGTTGRNPLNFSHAHTQTHTPIRYRGETLKNNVGIQ